MGKKFKLISHNSKEQRDYNGHDDTRKHLKVGKVYEAVEEIHSWHTKIIIDGKEFNSVCFEERS